MMEIQAISETVRPSGGKGIEEEKTQSLEALIAEFLDYQKPLVSARGWQSLRFLIRTLARWIDDEGLQASEVGINEATAYMVMWSQSSSPTGKPYATGTMSNHLKAARRFFDWLVDTQRRQSNPFREVDHPRHEQRLSRNLLTESQMGRLLTELRKFDEAPTSKQRRTLYRVHVFAELLYATGMRIDEAGGLKQEDFNWEQRSVYIARGKGGRPRTAFLTGYACQVIRLYLKQGRAAALSPLVHQDTLWGTRRNRLAMLVNQSLRQVCTKLGLPVITCHGFRHSLGTHLLRSGCDMRHIQVILGHESIQATQLYTRVDKEDLKRSLDEFHPRMWNRRGE